MEEFERVQVSHFGIDMDKCQEYWRKLHKIEWLIIYFESKYVLSCKENQNISLIYLDYKIRAVNLKNTIKTRKELFYKF